MSAAFSRCSFQLPRYSSEKLEFGDLDLAFGRAIDQVVDHLGHRAEMVEAAAGGLSDRLANTKPR